MLQITGSIEVEWFKRTVAGTGSRSQDFDSNFFEIFDKSSTDINLKESRRQSVLRNKLKLLKMVYILFILCFDVSTTIFKKSPHHMYI